MITIVGLGNPGPEYEKTRHNTGRIVLQKFLKDHADDELSLSKKYKALTTTGSLGKESFTILFPETFMNKSGTSLSQQTWSKKKAEQLVVVYDDLDLPIGTIRISFNRGSGGHRGVESIIRAIKTEAFVRIRVGISPTTPSGKLKKPHGGKDVEKFILGKFSPKELEVLKKVAKEVSGALEVFAKEGREVAMTTYN